MKDLDVEFETKISEKLERTIRQKWFKLLLQMLKSYAENVAKYFCVKIANVKQVSKFSPRNIQHRKVSEMKFDNPMMLSNPKNII
jgi:hypothetical protein